jgi:phosphoribosylanthranilate isomerase
MEPVKKPRVKICCINSVKDAKLAINYGVSAIGLVSKMPSRPGSISEDVIAKIAKTIPPFISSVLLTSKQSPSEIIAQHKKCQTNVVQLVDRMGINDYSKLRDAMPGIKLVQVVHVINEESIKEAISVGPYVNGILLDSGNPDLELKQLGGTGRIPNWDLSRMIREKVEVPVILAGGLDAKNVGIAMKQVQPFAVDVCNGVRTKNKLDEAKLSSFFEAINIYIFQLKIITLKLGLELELIVKMDFMPKVCILLIYRLSNLA